MGSEYQQFGFFASLGSNPASRRDKPNNSDKQSLFFAPLSLEKHLKIREQVRDYIHKRYILASETYTDQLHEGREKAKEFSKDYGQTFVRTVFLLNAGAILALLTLVGSLFGKGDHVMALVTISLTRDLVPALYWFAGGLVLAALVAAIAFFNFGFLAQSYPFPGQLFDFIHHQPFEQAPRTIIRSIGISYWAAVAAALGSLACFGSGVFLIAQAFSVLGVQ